MSDRSTELVDQGDPVADLTNREVVDLLARIIHGDDGAWVPQVVCPDVEAAGFRPGATWRFDVHGLTAHPVNVVQLDILAVDRWTLDLCWWVNGSPGPRRRMQIFARSAP